MQWIPSEKKEQPEQEPVAWMVYTQDGQSAYVTDNPTDIQELQQSLPLYTTPPQPKPEQESDDLTNVRYKANYRYETKWQSLTDDEIKEIIGSYAGPIKGYTRELFDKIDAKLREKNS